MRDSPETRNTPWRVFPLLVLAAPFILALVALVLFLHFVTSFCLHAAIWSWWSSRGRDTLFVYSNSPIWQSHIETEILPFVRSPAVVLNWSEHKRWRPGLAAAAFWRFGGERE